MSNKIDYIIKTHNELPYLAMYLSSLKYDNPDMWESANIIVFANRCTDGTQEWCKRNNIRCENVDLPGLYAIWNLGMSMTTNEKIVFSASDFILAPNFWNYIIEQAIEHPELHHFTGTCLDNGVSYPHPDVVERRWYNRNCGDNWKDFSTKEFIKSCVQINENTSSKITLNETSYCPFLTTREHYNFLNGFNTALGDYPTDIDHDFLRRGKEAGRECAIANYAYFYHFGKKSLLRRDGEGLEYTLEDIGDL